MTPMAVMWDYIYMIYSALNQHKWHKKNKKDINNIHAGIVISRYLSLRVNTQSIYGQIVQKGNHMAFLISPEDNFKAPLTLIVSDRLCQKHLGNWDDHIICIWIHFWINSFSQLIRCTWECYVSQFHDLKCRMHKTHHFLWWGFHNRNSGFWYSQTLMTNNTCHALPWG